MRRLFIALLASFVVIGLQSAAALCMYKGQMYAKTTIAEEFADAKWVVRAKVLAAENHWSGGDDPWTMYRLQVLTAFKGKLALRIRFFTYRDSGGFYLDKGMNADLGGLYLLFLDPLSPGAPNQARGATEVNYVCGQSKPWAEVSAQDKRRLAALSHANR